MKKLTLNTCLVDLHGTLAYLKNPLDYLTMSDHLIKNGFEVYPQELEAALKFVEIIDYPKLCLKDWASVLRKALWHLNVIVDDDTLNGLIELIQKPEFELYDDAPFFLKRLREEEFKIGLITTISEFRFIDAISKVRDMIDEIITGCTCKCEKSNPKMLKTALEILKAKPEQTVMVGDELIVDLYIPHRLGLKTIFLKRTGELPTIREADGIVRNLKEAAEMVIKIR